MTSYKHTQIGYLMLFMLVVLVLFYAWLYGVMQEEAGSDNFFIVVTAFVVLILASFASLTVTIDEQHLRLKFGYGIFRKSLPLREIASVKTVRNHWYYGWGIRAWFRPSMTIYNVSGFDAVELTQKNGKIFRIGTDEPTALEAALRQRIHS